MKAVVDATLTKIQKNQVLQLILQYGPPPGDFQWTEKQQDEQAAMVSLWPYRVFVLTHRPTGYYCIFSAHTITTSPGLNKKVKTPGTKTIGERRRTLVEDGS
jgi:hypothetical protein